MSDPTDRPGPPDFGAAPPPSAPSPDSWFDLALTPEPSPTRRRWWLFALGAAVIVAGGVAAAYFLLGDDSGPSHPGEWDARVKPLADFVERERKLQFEHPVRVDFLDEAAWKEQGAIDEEDIVDEDLQLLEHGAGLFRAIGLAEGQLDLLSDTEELTTSGTIGLYHFDDERITVRGERLTPKVKATLVHELTHVLQDQHYDVGDRLDRVQDGETSEASLRVLVEGDADRIEDLWIEGLPRRERAALEKEEAETGKSAEQALDELPSSLVTFFASSYILGSGFISVLEADGGLSAIDDAFRSPPGPEEHVFDPLAYLEQDEPETADAPAVDGVPIEDLDGDFGAVSWFLMLAERTDPVAALRAVDGWGDDAYQAYTKDGQTCVALRFLGEDPDATQRMAGVLQRWATAMPGAAQASVERHGDYIDVVACDPGEKADLIAGKGRSRGAISLPATRAVLAAGALEAGATVDQARCFSRGVIGALPYKLLVLANATPAQQRQIQAVAAEQAASCR